MKRRSKPSADGARTPIVTGDPDVDGALLELAEIVAAIAHNDDLDNHELGRPESTPRRAARGGTKTTTRPAGGRFQQIDNP